MRPLLPGAFVVGAPCLEFAPAGDLLFVSTKSRQKTTPAKPPLRGSLRALPLASGKSLGRRRTARRRCARSCLGASQPGAAPNSLRYAPFKQRGAKSVVDARFARAPGFCASRRFRRGGPETAEQPNSRNSQLPNAQAGWRRLFLQSPLEPAEQRKDLRACAKRTSRTDSAQLFDRSVAEGVLRGSSRPEQRREARRAGRIGGRLFAYFLVAQKVGRPPGLSPDTRQPTAGCLVPGEGLAACKRQGRTPGTALTSNPK